MQSLPDLFQEIDTVIESEPSNHTHPSSRPDKGHRAHNILFVVMVIGLAVSTGVIAFYGLGPILSPPAQHQPIISQAPDIAEVLSAQDQPQIKDIYSQEQKSQILQKLSAHIQIPVDDVTANILGVTELPEKTEGVLANAEVGDALVIFPDSNTAYLYRPSTDQIISSASVD